MFRLKLKHLILYNIGPFRGRHIIDLNSESSVTGYAFFAANGRGKTSIYNAMKWCLFGQVKTRVRASGGMKIQPKLRPITGEADTEPLMNNDAYENENIPEMEVILLAEGSQGNIQVSRRSKVYRAAKRKDDNLSHNLVATVGTKSASGTDAEELIQNFSHRHCNNSFSLMVKP